MITFKRKTLVCLGLIAAAAAVGCQSSGPSPSSNSSTSAPPAWALRPLQPPPVDLNASYIVQEFAWKDSTRNREIPAVLYLPKALSSADAKKVPLVVFSHGLGGSRYGYSHLGKFWASNGIATVALQHPGSDRAIWTSQGFSVLSSLKSAANLDNAVARAVDVTFAIDTLLGDGSVKDKIDFSKVAVAGHSFGANTALLSAGAQFYQDNKLTSYGDKRIKAAVVLSAPALPTSENAKEVYGKIRIPTLHLTGTHDHTPIPGAITTADMRRQPYDAIQGASKYLGVYDGGRHSMFNDRTRDATSEAIKESARVTSLQFFRSVFDPPDMQAKYLEVLRDGARARLDKEKLFNWESTN
jgi:predicted dienelactone hydrolase